MASKMNLVLLPYFSGFLEIKLFYSIAQASEWKARKRGNGNRGKEEGRKSMKNGSIIYGGVVNTCSSISRGENEGAKGE